MQHACSHCGSDVDDTSAFCTNCGSPQVRFSGPPPATQSVTVQIPQSVPPVVFDGAEPTFPDSRPTAANNNRALIRAAAAGGAIGALVSTLPFGVIVGPPLAGFLAVLFYRKWSPAKDLSSSAGFRTGAFGGSFGFVIFAIVATVEILSFQKESAVRDAIIQAIQTQEVHNPDPQSLHFLEYFLTPHGIAVMMVFGLIFTCVIFVLLAGIGGTISATVFRRKPPRL